MPYSTKMEQIANILAKLRQTVKSGKCLSIEFRKEQLFRFQKMVKDNQEALCESIRLDTDRPQIEAFIFEIQPVLNEIQNALDNIDEWMKPVGVKRGVLQLMDKAYTVRDAKGLVLIISPWNYPVNLILMPFVGAIAAGNCVVLKPSELASNVGKLLAKLAQTYFQPDTVAVINGDADQATKLLEFKFDHIFFTGSTRVGKMVMAAASKHLTPVTLELGGKCPVIIASDCHITNAAKRIAWGKFMSSGQTCIAPDYVLCSRDVYQGFLAEMQKAVLSFYGENPKECSQYMPMGDYNHMQKLIPLMTASGRVEFGGEYDSTAEKMYLAPTLVTDVKPDDPIMKKEIFGPILPVIAVDSMEEAIEIVNSKPKPLALYLFTSNQKLVDKVLKRTSSGGVTVNDVLLHIFVESLPFGGVGESGQGRYHGKFTFDEFSHEKAILHRQLKAENMLWMRYTPYDKEKLFWMTHFSRRWNCVQFCIAKYLPLFLMGLFFGFFCRFIFNAY